MLFFLSYLIDYQINEAKKIINDIEYINANYYCLRLKLVRKWKYEKFKEVFSCKNHKIWLVISFLISNLILHKMILKTQTLFISHISYQIYVNLSLVVENQYLNGEYKKAKNFKNFKR